MTKLPNDPYAKKRFAYQCAAIEFDHFLRRAKEQVLTIIDRMPAAGPLKNTHSLCVDIFGDGPGPKTLQAWFGKHPTGRRTIEGGTDVEIGATLVYSLGPTGVSAVMLYPCKSDSCRVREERIILRLGRFTAYQLQKNVHRDLRDLVSYTYVSALDGAPSVLQWVRVSWLRLSRITFVDDKQRILGLSWLARLSQFMARVGLIVLLRPLALAAIIFFLIWVGWWEFASPLFEFRP